MSATAGAILVGAILGISALACLVTGFGFIKTAISQINIVMASKKWPFVEGQVISSEVREENRKKRNEETGRITYYSRYRPIIKYHYVVNDHTYTSTQRVIGEEPTFDTVTKAEALLNNYPAGRNIQVFYNPSAPKNGVLEPGNIADIWRTLLGGLICLGVAYLLIKIGTFMF